MEVFMIVAVLRLSFHSSTMKAIEISLIDIVEVSDARVSSKKKSADHTTPPGRLWNIAGRTSNTSVGPAWGEKPKEKTAGKIITPARSATKVSSTAVVIAVFPSLVLSPKYDAYVVMQPSPRLREKKA